MDKTEEIEYKGFLKSLEIYLLFMSSFFSPKDLNIAIDNEKYLKVDKQKQFNQFMVELVDNSKNGFLSSMNAIKITKSLERYQRTRNLIVREKVLIEIKTRLESLLFRHKFKYFMHHFKLERKDFSRNLENGVVEFRYKDNLIYIGTDDISKKNFMEKEIEFFSISLEINDLFTSEFIYKDFLKIFTKKGKNE